MTSRTIPLKVSTSPGWLDAVLANFDAFLADHANCERKASAMAMGMVVKYPDRPAVIARLIDIAREELEHFAEVYALMQSRHVALARDTRDDYIVALMAAARHGRDERFLDRLLLASIVECRGAERFALVAAAHPEPAVAAFYERLRKSEVKHGHVFADLAIRYFSPEDVHARLAALAEHEADVVSALPARPALH